MNKYNRKLLSHRFCGLADLEYSKESFINTGLWSIKYFELDTRVGMDGVIYVSHDRGFQVSNRKYKIKDLSAEQMSSLTSELLLLSDALQLFAAHSSSDQQLCIDIKDYGYERAHLDLIRKYDLEQRVIFISWIPQSIIRLNQLNALTPLILSCWNLKKLNLLGKALSDAISGVCKPFGQYVVLGERRISDSMQGLSMGYQHSLICTEIPEFLLGMLKSSGGGICIHKSMFCRKTGAYCRENGIQLWLYNESNPKKYRRLAENDLVHVIFSDAAPALSRIDIDRGE